MMEVNLAWFAITLTIRQAVDSKAVLQAREANREGNAQAQHLTVQCV